MFVPLGAERRGRWGCRCGGGHEEEFSGVPRGERRRLAGAGIGRCMPKVWPRRPRNKPKAAPALTPAEARAEVAGALDALRASQEQEPLGIAEERMPRSSLPRSKSSAEQKQARASGQPCFSGAPKTRLPSGASSYPTHLSRLPHGHEVRRPPRTDHALRPVSYTHLTLPTICSV